MEQRALGRSGFTVSRIILGCGNVGGIGSSPEFFGQGESEAEGHELMDAAWALGITCFDTAASYGGGASESAIGSWSATRGAPVTVTTKVFHSVHGDPDDSGLAPERVRRELDASLERLGVERVDLYMIHEPDPATPLQETLVALDGLVREGKVGAIGASNVDGPYLEESLRVSRELGLARFEWVQNSYNLLDREAEREVLPICAREGLGFTPFSPLAGGWLTGKYRRAEPYPAGSRMTLRPEPYAELENDRVFDALEAFGETARSRGSDPASLALAWLLGQPQITAVVVGPRRPAQLDPVTSAVALHVTPSSTRRALDQTRLGAPGVAAG